MAEGEAAPASGKGGLIKILILVAGVLVLTAGGYFGWRWWSARKAAREQAQALKGPEDPAKEEEEEDSKGGEHGGASAAVLVLKPIVNLGERKNAFLKCELHIVFRDPELGKQATSDKPTLENSTIRAMTLEALSGKSVEEVADPETRESVRKELKDKLNEHFAPKVKPGEKPKGKAPKKPVKDVLVVDWAIAQ